MTIFISSPSSLFPWRFYHTNDVINYFLKTMGAVIEFRITGEETTKNLMKGIVALSDGGTSTGAQRESTCRMLFPYARFPPVLMNFQECSMMLKE